jgi:beta-glucanase (GH16 family)
VVKIATLPFTHEQTVDSLKLRAGYRDGKLIGGMISTEDWMRFNRGTIEFHARINSIPNGYHIAFWLLPADGAWPPEEDMLEVVHGQNNPSNGKAHFNDHPSSAPISHRPVDNAWHVYRFEATDAGMKWFMDGQLVRQNNRPITKPRYWLATWEGNSNWPGPITDKAAVAEVEIDYLRIEEVP